jgi:hypothetical protein
MGINVFTSICQNQQYITKYYVERARYPRTDCAVISLFYLLPKLGQAQKLFVLASRIDWKHTNPSAQSVFRCYKSAEITGIRKNLC